MYDLYDNICSLCEKEFRADRYEERFCWDCRAKNEVTMELVFDYLKENLSIKVDSDYGFSTRWIELYLINPKTKQDERVCSTSFSVYTEGE